MYIQMSRSRVGTLYRKKVGWKPRPNAPYTCYSANEAVDMDVERAYDEMVNTGKRLLDKIAHRFDNGYHVWEELSDDPVEAACKYYDYLEVGNNQFHYDRYGDGCRFMTEISDDENGY